ncbi:MAG: phosphoribosylglycinamide formyltransferase [Marinifilaceae bacterium]|nr:phosphoribosylglycinamide formyltransferase [Marinifilaceae bacterium]
MTNIAIFASGTGTNAKNIIDYFHKSQEICIKAIFCNNPNAGILKSEIPTHIERILFTKEEFYDKEVIEQQLELMNIEYIILAGFLLLIPCNIIERYKNRIINIHPALLPKFGGKGMYGMNVHRAVIESGEKETGITIHTIDSKYDGGETIFQAKCPVEPDDTPESVAAKVHALEYRYFPKQIERYISLFHV